MQQMKTAADSCRAKTGMPNRICFPETGARTLPQLQPTGCGSSDVLL